MPGRDGFEILAGLAPQVRGPDMLPVCVITADSDIKVRRQALQMGHAISSSSQSTRSRY